MKHLTKLLALLLALSLLISCVPALAEEVPEGYPDILIDPATGKPYDLGGITVYIYGYNGTEDGSRPEPTTALEMDTYDYQDWLMETYNFQYKVVKHHLYDDNAQALLDFASQEVAPETALFVMVQSNMLQPLRTGLLQPLSGYDFIDVNDETRWMKGITDVYTLGGKTYALCANPDGIDGKCGLLFFNKDLLRDFGIDPDSLYEMVENDEWNFEAYEEVLKQCTRDLDNDGVIDVYGMVGNGQGEFKNAAFNNGGAFFSIDDNGKFYVSASDDAVVDAMNWFEKIWFTYNYPKTPDSSWDYYYEAFKSGKAVFYRGAIWELGGPLSGIEDQFEFGAIPFPMGMGVNAHYTDFQDPAVWVLPANVPAENAWKAVFAYNIMNTPTPGYTEEDEAWKQNMYNTFMDEESVDISCEIMLHSGAMDLTSMLGNSNDMLGSNFFWAYIYDGALGAHTVAELIEGKMPMWSAAIAAANGEAVEEAPAE